MVDTDPRDKNTWIVNHDPLHVVRLTDPVIDQAGHDVRSSYVETYWLPILGPTAIWVNRRLADRLDASSADDGIEVSLAELGLLLGISGRVSRHSPLVRTLIRLVDFGVASIGGSSYGVRTTFAPVPLRHQRNLPPSLLERHQLELESAR